MLIGLCAAFAATPVGAATVTIRPARPAVGSSVVVDLSGFARRTAVSVRLAGRSVALARTGPAGGASLRFDESRRARTGRVSLTAGTHRSRIRTVIRVLRMSSATATSLTADLGTLRALLSPAAARSATKRTIHSWGWRHDARVTLTLAGKKLAAAHASKAGVVDFTRSLPAATGNSRVVLAGAGRRLVVPFSTLRTPAARTTVPPKPTPTPSPVPPIVTPPTPPAAPDVVVAAAGDIACAAGMAPTSNSCQQQATADVVKSMSPDAVLPLGDTQYQTGALSDYQASYAPSWGVFDSIAHPVPGDQEYSNGNADGYFVYFGASAGDPAKGYYAYSLGNWRIYALNTSSDCQYVSCSAQNQWLRADLAAHPGACQLAYWHQPLFNSGNAYLSPAMKSSLQPIWADLDAAGVELVVNGNDHHYERFQPQDENGQASTNAPREFIVGTGGRNHANPPSTIAPNSVASARNYSTFGALRLTLKNDSYNWKFMPVAGKTFTDSGSGSCH